jgi:hypothetical protein
MRIFERIPTRSFKFPTECMGVSRLGYPWIPWIPPPIRACAGCPPCRWGTPETTVSRVAYPKHVEGSGMVIL